MAIQHKEVSFDFEGSVNVETQYNGRNTCRVTLNGAPCTSDCEDKVIGELFGVDNIINAAGNHEVLNHIDVDDIAEYLSELDSDDIQKVIDRLNFAISEDE